MKKLLPLCLLLLACDDEPGAQRLLEIEGYTDIAMTGYAYVGCKKGDAVRTGFDAKLNGQVIAGAVCCTWGLLTQTCTIRQHLPE